MNLTDALHLEMLSLQGLSLKAQSFLQAAHYLPFFADGTPTRHAGLGFIVEGPVLDEHLETLARLINTAVHYDYIEGAVVLPPARMPLTTGRVNPDGSYDYGSPLRSGDWSLDTRPWGPERSMLLCYGYTRHSWHYLRFLPLSHAAMFFNSEQPGELAKLYPLPAPLQESSDVIRARRAYRRYAQHTGYLNWQQLPMPTFDELPELQRGAWIAALTDTE